MRTLKFVQIGWKNVKYDQIGFRVAMGFRKPTHIIWWRTLPHNMTCNLHLHPANWAQIIFSNHFFKSIFSLVDTKFLHAFQIKLSSHSRHLDSKIFFTHFYTQRHWSFHPKLAWIYFFFSSIWYALFSTNFLYWRTAPN